MKKTKKNEYAEIILTDSEIITLEYCVYRFYKSLAEEKDKRFKELFKPIEKDSKKLLTKLRQLRKETT